jgi:diguanylate cyclase (GGDEF)-like protein
MDLDGFKLVNDQYGHAIGDALLVQVSTLFKKMLRQSDFFARQGGDEFVLIVTDYMHRAELIQLAQRLIHLFKQPIIVKNVAAQIGVSIGIAEYPHHGLQAKHLLLAADEAMYVSKKNGKNRYSFAMQIQQAEGESL